MYRFIKHARMRRIPYMKILRVVAGVGVTVYTGSKFFRFYDEYAKKVEGLRRLVKSFDTRGGVQNGLSFYDFFVCQYQLPMAFLVPEDSEGLARLLSMCDKFGIAVGFSDRPDYLDEHILNMPMDRPFVLVDIRKLSGIKSTGTNKFEVGVGTTLDDIIQYCNDKGLDVPYYIESDRSKTLWRLMKENSMSLHSMMSMIDYTESLLFDGQILSSSNVDNYGKDMYDIKGLLISENDYISVIHKMHMTYNTTKPAIYNNIEFDVSSDGGEMNDVYRVLDEFVSTWRDDIRIHITRQDKRGRVYSTMKISTDSRDKYDVIHRHIEEMNRIIHQYTYNNNPVIHIDTMPPMINTTNNNTVNVYMTGNRHHVLPYIHYIRSYILNTYDIRDMDIKYDHLSNSISINICDSSDIDMLGIISASNHKFDILYRGCNVDRYNIYKYSQKQQYMGISYSSIVSSLKNVYDPHHILYKDMI